MLVVEGKSYHDISGMKADFLDENKKYLDENAKIASFYRQQPERKGCKICGQRLDHKVRFFSHNLEYYVCDNCGHINGAYEETIDFTTQIYERSGYEKNYRVDDKSVYQNRLNKIYLPKAEFLKHALQDDNIDCSKLECLDVGAGSGYFVGALEQAGFHACGIEVSEQQVNWGNDMLSAPRLYHLPQEMVPSYIKTTKAGVVCFVGVLEHIVDLQEVLNAIDANDNVKYIFFSVPMFSYSVVLEAANPNVFNRLLGGAHTHIFTDESLSYLYNVY